MNEEQKISMRELKFQEEMDSAFKGLSQILNNFSYDTQAKTFHKVLEKEHPTLQQNFWRMINSVIFLYAESECYRDARNEASAEYCKFLKDKIQEAQNEHLPHHAYFPTV